MSFFHPIIIDIEGKIFLKKFLNTFGGRIIKDPC